MVSFEYPVCSTPVKALKTRPLSAVLDQDDDASFSLSVIDGDDSWLLDDSPSYAAAKAKWIFKTDNDDAHDDDTLLLNADDLAGDELIMHETDSFRLMKYGSEEEYLWPILKNRKKSKKASLKTRKPRKTILKPRSDETLTLNADDLAGDELIMHETDSFRLFKNGSEREYLGPIFKKGKDLKKIKNLETAAAANAATANDSLPLCADDLTIDELIMHETDSFLIFKNGSEEDYLGPILKPFREQQRLRNSKKANAAAAAAATTTNEDTVILTMQAEEGDEDLFEDSPSFVLFKSCPGEYEWEDLSWLTEPSSRPSLEVPKIVLTAALEGGEVELAERPQAALEDTSKPKMQRLLAFWKAQEQKTS